MLVLIVALLLAGSPARAAGRPRWGGVIRVAGPPVSTLDPRGALSDGALLAAALLHQPLYDLDAPDAAPRPALLAAAPTGDLDLACALHDGARFHDGRPVTSDDVAWSIERLAAGPAGSPARVLPELVRVEPTDARRFVLRLRAPVPRATLERLLALPQAAILPRGSDGAVGAGPFALVDAGTGGALVLGPHLGHPAGRPFADRLELLPARTAADMADRLYYGDADVALRRSPRLEALSDVSRIDGPTVEALVLLPPSGARGARGAVPAGLADLAGAPILSRLDREAELARALLPALPARAPAPPPGAVTLTVQAGVDDLQDVAAVLRDRAIAAGGEGSRVAPAGGLLVAAWRWTEPTPIPAALQALGVAGTEPRALRDLAARVSPEDDAPARLALADLEARGAVAAVLHLRRAAWVRGSLRGVRFDGHGSLALADAWWPR